MIYATVGELVDDRRHARAYGAIYTIGSVCGIVSPLAVGALADWQGLESALVVVALAVLGTLGLLGVLGRAVTSVPST